MPPYCRLTNSLVPNCDINVLSVVFQLILGSLPNAPALLKGAAVQLQLRIKGIQRADAGVYSCKAANRHGVTIKIITLSV